MAEQLAELHGGRIVDRDMVRHMLYQTYWNPERIDEKVVTETQSLLIDAGLRYGENVYVPDMNLRNQYVTRLIAQAKALNSTWVIVDLTDVDLEVCLARNEGLARRLKGKTVERDVIRGLHERYIKGRAHPLPLTVSEGKRDDTKREVYVGDRNKRQAIIVDIDGTVAHMKDRGPFDEHLVSQDTFDVSVGHMVHSAADQGCAIIFMSGRTTACYDDTEQWLLKHMPWLDGADGHDRGFDWDLLMRREVEDRGRPDDDVKYDLFMRNVAPYYNVLYSIDDRDKVVKMWREIGLTCAQVAYGDF
jgi:hypothetical protein